MKRKVLDQIDRKLEEIITKLVDSGRDPANPSKGMLNTLEFESLKAAQDALSLLRANRKAA